jgi:hypothetical protein
MATISRVNGQVAAGAFYGYSPLVIQVTDSATTAFTADTGGAGAAIVEGGYTKAVKAMQTLGSIVWLGARTDAHYFTCIVDAPSFNQGGGAITAGLFGALVDAMVLAGVTATVGNLSVKSGTVLANTGAFTLA